MAHNYFLMEVLVGITSQQFVVAVDPAPPIPASADPCSLAVLVVHYPSFGDDCGETVSLDLVNEGIPSVVSYADADQTKLYTLMMVDPDAPDVTDPKFAYYIHWLIVNIEGGDLIKGVYKNGTELTSYQHPLPELGSGLHRYQFFVFEQALRLDISATPNGRAFFDVHEFMTSKRLTPPGPLAGYQFLSEEMEVEPTSLTSATPNDGVTATTPSAGAVILKGNAVMLVIMALFAVVQLAR